MSLTSFWAHLLPQWEGLPQGGAGSALVSGPWVTSWAMWAMACVSHPPGEGKERSPGELNPG